MALNLKKLGEASLLDKEVDPREIFNLLSEKDARYQYPRDVQAEVWNRWLQVRNQPDVIVKMNTGGGKTVVGLLLLKSCLNEGHGPAVYLTPDKYLARQVVKEANDLGIPVVIDPRAGSFQQGEAILVTNIYVLMNGKSVFGTAETGIKIAVGSVVVDDAHACLAATENQFTLTIDGAEQLYADLFKLFREDLYAQSETTVLEIEAGVREPLALVPFWSWQAKADAVAKLLTKHRDDESVRWTWPLVRDHLNLCRCVFSAGRVEISPRCLPIDSIPSFVGAKRRIFMTATLADDSILVSDFGAKPENVVNHITPQVANDIGERMILAPQEINPDLGDDDLKAFVAGLAKTYNTVVIVPSEYRAAFWEDVAAAIATAENLASVVESLRQGHVGLVVLVNKYDGVDLPGDACRILVLDGLPQARKLIERIETNILAGSKQLIGRQIQRIEQGMGRGIRGRDDFAVVLLMGASVTRSLFFMGAKEMFSPATLAQFELSKKVAAQLGRSLAEVQEAIEVCLKRDKEWRRLAREAVANVAYPEKGAVREVAVAQRDAFEAASIRDFKGAEAAMQEAVDAARENKDGDAVEGWLLWQLAEYTQHRDGVEAQQMLKAAIHRNRRVLKPLDGINYDRLDSKKLVQAENVAWNLKPYKAEPNKLVVYTNGVLEDLKFAEDNASEFEAAMNDLAGLIGFQSQRPELEYKKGPDVLWAVGGLRYFVIECKSGASVDTVTKYYANQLAGSVNWFGARYSDEATSTPILVHPANSFEHAATPPPDTRVITEDRLAKLREAVRAFVKALVAGITTMDAAKAKGLLEHHRLTPESFLGSYTVAPKAK